MIGQHICRFAALILLCSLPGCGSSTSYDGDEEPSYFAGEGDEGVGAKFEEEATEFDEDSARTDAEQEVADEGYSGPCTIDCSGHDAGFAWAADGNPDYGDSRSQSFDEGQEAFEEAVEERLEEKRQEFEDEGADSEYAQ